MTVRLVRDVHLGDFVSGNSESCCHEHFYARLLVHARHVSTCTQMPREAGGVPGSMYVQPWQDKEALGPPPGPSTGLSLPSLRLRK